jgi:hypothetical protein
MGECRINNFLSGASQARETFHRKSDDAEERQEESQNGENKHGDISARALVSPDSGMTQILTIITP